MKLAGFILGKERPIANSYRQEPKGHISRELGIIAYRLPKESPPRRR